MKIGFILFPDLTQLDFTGPLQVLHRMPGSETHILAKSLEPVPSDCGLGLMPTGRFEAAPQLDLICVPGGAGVVGAMRDTQTVDFIRRQAEGARWVTSVCTGAFLLGRAGLLRGKRATTHWAYTELLPLTGAIYEPGRVVRDGNLVTAGGVTSGIDFGFTLLAEISGEALAKTVQLGLEYDPAPPFDCGHPSKAPEAAQALAGRYEKVRGEYLAALAGS